TGPETIQTHTTSTATRKAHGVPAASATLPATFANQAFTARCPSRTCVGGVLAISAAGRDGKMCASSLRLAFDGPAARAACEVALQERVDEQDRDHGHHHDCHLDGL